MNVTRPTPPSEIACDRDAERGEELVEIDLSAEGHAEHRLDGADDRMVEAAECDQESDEPCHGDARASRAGCSLEEPRHQCHQRLRDEAAEKRAE
ncbi:MAG: hypothetical protein ABR569_12245 [Gaiellaceae bacterium]